MMNTPIPGQVQAPGAALYTLAPVIAVAAGLIILARGGSKALAAALLGFGVVGMAYKPKGPTSA
jgi:hypothetical protein